MSAGRVIVVGAGMAGLACAVQLCRRGVEVLVLEAAPTIGGRTRNFNYRGVELDNGQHLMLSIYGQLQRLLSTVGASQNGLFHHPFSWVVYTPTEASQDPEPGQAIAPTTHISNRAGLCSMVNQLSQLSNKPTFNQRLLTGLGVLRLLALRAPAHLTATQWLARQGQNPIITRLLWAPLCLAALNTPPEQASARCLQTVLRRVLPKGAGLSFVFNRSGLGQALAEPCRKFLLQNNAQLHTGHRVVEVLSKQQGHISGVRTSCGRHWAAETVVLSTPIKACNALLQNSGLGEHCPGLDRIESAPIHTWYLQFAGSLGGTEAMFGLLEVGIDWIIDREIVNDQTGLIAAVSSARPIQISIESIVAILKKIYPTLPELLWHKAVLEKNATHICTPDIEALRPSAHLPVGGLWLNGDWVRNPLPATIETAVDNGMRCAEHILADNPSRLS